VEKLAQVRCRLIANDMGTGKTYEAIALDLCARKDMPNFTDTLVIAPGTVLPSWKQHYEELTDLPVTVINPKDREGSWLRFKKKGGVFLMHWEAVRLMPDTVGKHSWLHVIADECHKMQNRKAQQTRAVKKIHTFYKTGLSGTPTTGFPDKLWSTLNWLYPKTWSSYWKFYKDHVEFEIVYPQGFHKITGPKNEAQLLAEMDPFYVRHLKEDVLPDLPPKYYTDIWVELTPQQRKAYQQMKKELIAWVGQHESQPLVAPVVIAQLVRLQQFAVAYAGVDDDLSVKLAEPSSKLDALMQILEDNPTKQFVVFSQFKQLIYLLKLRLEAAGITHCLLTGDTPQSERGQIVERFQSGAARVFAGTIAAGGVGITLHAASTVIFLDRNWSPALNQQAEDRLHRIGQREAVQVIDIMARDTVDLGRRQMLEQKWDWIRRLLGDV
jgi:SNF2 family DNA or RNA helicase